jgi:alpha-D-xyloside xylohydrolase
MAAELRGGLSFGLSGFAYWSHDVGGFVDRAPRDLYRRWMAFGVLTSHVRAHGAPPREPWEYDQALTDDFRGALNLRYSLMPYIYAQAKDSSARGFPMVRTLFFEFPNDPTSWLIEDEYMFGSDLLVAPLFEESSHRRVYLPPGKWIDYQTGNVFEGARWHEMTAGKVPIVLLVKDDTVLPHVKPAQSTADIDWSNVELRVFSTRSSPVEGLFTMPDGDLQRLQLQKANGSYSLARDVSIGKIKWDIGQVKTLAP